MPGLKYEAERYMEKITSVVPSVDGSDTTIRHYESLASGHAGKLSLGVE